MQIMVAETASRRKGVAIEALNIFMAYAVRHLVSALLQFLLSLYTLCPVNISAW